MARVPCPSLAASVLGRPTWSLCLPAALAASWVVAAGCDAAGDDDSADPGDDDTAAADDDTGPGYEPDPDVDSYVPEAYRAKAPQRLVVLGDSISAGVGASGQGNAYPDLLVSNNASQWPDSDGEDLETLYPDLAEVIDLSQGGALTVDVIDDQLPALEEELTYPAAGETLVVMTAGGNDAQLALVLPDQVDEILTTIEENFRLIAEYFGDPTRFPDGAYLYATNVYEPTDAVGQSASCFFGFDFSDMMPSLEDGNARMRVVAEEEGVALVDLRGHFLGHGVYHDDPSNAWYESEDPTQWFSSDCIHPNNRGHHELRRLFFYAVAGMPLPDYGQQVP